MHGHAGTGDAVREGRRRGWCGLFASGLLWASGCGGGVQAASPVAVATPRAARAERLAGPSNAAPPTGQALIAGMHRLWVSDTGSWNRVVEIAPFGDVVSVGSRQIHVHARDTGKVLESGEACFVRDRHTLVFLDATRAVLVCPRELVEYTFPGLHARVLAPLDPPAVVATAGPEWVATATRDGHIAVRGIEAGGTRDTVQVGGAVAELALSPDGRWLAVGLESGAVLVRDLEKRTTREVHQGDRRARGLAFTRDGEQLFVHNKSFEARVLRTREGTEIRTYRVGPWVSAAAYGVGAALVTTGSDGMQIWDADTGTATLLPFDEAGGTGSCEGLAVGDDGAMVCGGDRRGRVVCYSRQRPEASTYLPLAGERESD